MVENIFENELKKDEGKFYIWHCPNLDCKTRGIVLFKTELPYIAEGKIKCINCGKLYTFTEIYRENKRNFDRYLEKISNHTKKT